MLAIDEMSKRCPFYILAIVARMAFFPIEPLTHKFCKV